MRRPANPTGDILPSRTFTGSADAARRLCAQLVDGAIDQSTFLERCTRLTNAIVGSSRTGIWMFVDTGAGRVLRCLAMYDSVADRMTSVPDEKREVQPYFDELEQSGFVMAHNAQVHPATMGLLARRLSASGVRSLLASAFSVNGHLFGAFTCTQVGELREWTPRQLATLRQIGGPASLALYKASRFTPDTGLGPLI
jgi:GAF domain-containing protein